jgi:site-specific DNA recombinase
MSTRVSTLTRRSTDEQHQPFSIELQDTKLGSYIRSQDDWTLVRKYTDNKSGATLDREGLQRALADARAGLYDILLVYKVDRLARTVRGLAQILDELDAAGVAFRSATEPFDTSTAAGRMLVQMLGVIAEFERATIIDRVIGGMERKAARGEWCGGYRPFGYQVKKTADKTHVLVLHPAEAPLVPVIFDHYANQRLGAQAIATWLNGQGYRTKVGKPWGHMAVRTVLRNRVYLGEVFFRDAWHPGLHQPLVDQATFDAVQELMAERGEAHSKRASNASDYLLVSRVRCLRCGKRFVGAAAHGKLHRYPYYVCFSRQRYGTATCPAERLRADLLDQAVIEALLKTFQQTDLFEQAVAASRTQAELLHEQHQAELTTVTEQIRKAEATIERYLDAFEAGTMSDETCGQRVEKQGAKIAELRVRQADLRRALDTVNIQAPTPQELADLAEQVRVALSEGPTPARKRLLHALVHEVQVQGRDAIFPVFRVPGGEPPAPGGGVRTMYGSVPTAGFEPAAYCSGGSRSIP